MKKKSVSFLTVALIVLFSGIVLFANVSCKNIGVGDAIDLEAPKVAITSPGNNDYVQKSFVLQGTASDNYKISDIEVQYVYRKTPESPKITGIAHATMNGSKSGEWTCHLEFSFDQEVAITVYARDPNRNESIDSSDSIVVVIDSKEPENETMLITRNSGFTTRTAKVDKFLGPEGRTAKRNTDSANKDNFQNESIYLSCNVKETYEIDKVYLDLYEISNYVSPKNYSKTKIAEQISINENTTNLYNPEFTITQESLNSYSSALASGLHYIMPEVVVIDKAGNQSKPFSLSSDGVPMVFAWEAEYDVPKASLPLYYENDLLKFSEGTKVPVIIFDDDGLKSYSYKLVRDNDPSKIKTGSENISDKNLRDHSFEIETEYFDGERKDENKITDGNYTLYITVEDQLTSVMGGGIRETKTYNWTVPVKITNADAPTIDVSNPAYNSTPGLTDKSKFNFECKTIDNGPVSKIAVAWCRDDDSKTAIDYFEKTFDFEKTATNKDAKIESDDKKLVVWYIGRDDAKGGQGTPYQDTFSKTFNIYTDFTDANGKVVNKSKVLVIAAKDLTGNVSTEVWRVGAYSSLPKFTITTSEDSGFTGSSTKVQTQPIISAVPGRNLYVKIVPSSDLDLEEFKVDGGICDISGKNITITDTLSGTKKEIKYYAKDKIGNANEGTFTIQFDEIPKIENIICNQVGTTLRMNDTLSLQVLFDRTITVTGTPKLNLSCTGTSSGNMELDCVTTGSSSSLTFSKKITEEMEYDEIEVTKNGTKWINLPTGAAIRRGEEIDANLEKDSLTHKFSLTIDSRPPKLTYDGANAGTGTNTDAANFTRNADNDVEIKLNFSEPVTVQNGYIDIWMKNSDKTAISGSHTWHIPAVISAEVFEKIWNNSENTYRIALSGSATEKSVNGKDAYNQPTIVSAGPYKMYTNGLKLNENPIYQYQYNSTLNAPEKSNTVIHAKNKVMVPDLTTKYVLDWQYDTDATSGKVKEIREALERANYHKVTIPLSRLEKDASDSSGKTWKLTLKNSDFIDGIRDGVEYIMEIPKGAVVDKVQNPSGKIDKYTFSVGNIATPIIRVRRWSTNSNTAINPTTEEDGKAQVKIDCETPSAAIKYEVTSLTVTNPETATDDMQKNVAPPDYNPVYNGNITTDTTSNDQVPKGSNGSAYNNVSVLTAAQATFEQQNYTLKKEKTATYSSPFKIGDGSHETGQKIYIVAQATTSSVANLQASEPGYEGAFKTVFYHKNPYSDSGWAAEAYKGPYIGDNFKVFAVQAPEGVSYVAGWPLTMRQHWHPSDTEVGTRDGYKLSYKVNNGSDYYYIFMSWELVSDDFFTMTSVARNFQVNIDSLASSGAFIWCNHVRFHGLTAN